MLTYQLRRRMLRIHSSTPVSFPTEVTLNFFLKPEQPFGVTAAGGRTCVRGAGARFHFNGNTGEYTIESLAPLKPLNVFLDVGGDETIELKGNILTVIREAESLEHLGDIIQTYYFCIPVLLNLPFQDPPYVERVSGKLGTKVFRWELAEFPPFHLEPTTQEEQEAAVRDACKRINVLGEGHRRRLIAGLHYFHVACRLQRAGQVVGEFTPEILLNLTKALEILFPPDGDGRTRDAVRAGLKSLGFSESEVEAHFMPAMALRNEIDVGHVFLGVFSQEQSEVIHAYTERVERWYRILLSRVLERIESGEWDVPAAELTQVHKNVVAIVDRLKNNTPVEPIVKTHYVTPTF